MPLTYISLPVCWLVKYTKSILPSVWSVETLKLGTQVLEQISLVWLILLKTGHSGVVEQVPVSLIVI